KGDLGYKDLSKDGNVDSKDRTFLGSDIPRYTYGLNLNASYKGIDFSAFFQGVGKVDINTLQFNKAPVNSDGNFRDFQTDNWRTDNVNASFPRLITETQNYVSSSFWMKSGAYLRLKNIQLGYTIPVSLTQKVGISRFRIYIAGQNVVTWSPLNKYGIDPENPIDNRYYPQVKTYTAGVNVEF
ncbi:MAG: SusC/RagA family TonB-linked outer membrane protein, partial [Bacteroidota bacterium]|nr:SusC/RagA family TonB-linked outer membrane protein [Bacteroidota bacterium]